MRKILDLSEEYKNVTSILTLIFYYFFLCNWSQEVTDKLAK